jgi:DNA-binding CsgD family transcriptional regulator
MPPEEIEKLKIVINQYSKNELKLNEGFLLLDSKGLNCLFCNSFITNRLGYKKENGIPQINRDSILQLLHPDYKVFFQQIEHTIYKELIDHSQEENEKFRANFLLRLCEIGGNYNYYMVTIQLTSCDADHLPCIIQIYIKRIIPDYKPVDSYLFRYSFHDEDNIESLRAKFHLTDMEAKVIMYALMKYSIKQTAIILGISPSTIQNHRNSAYKKMGIHDVSSIEPLI